MSTLSTNHNTPLLPCDPIPGCEASQDPRGGETLADHATGG